MQAARQLKANLKFKGQPCAICQGQFELGEDLSICNDCEAQHHTRCWDSHGGCSREGCVNAPLRRMAEPVQSAANDLPPGMKRCPSCRSKIHEMEQLCPYCDAVTSPDGVYRGPRENAPGATASLVYGILGFFICGVIFGILAIVKSKEARDLIASNPRYQGGGMATAGLVLGIIDLIAWVIIIMARMGG